ncbi:MAG TPA: glycosyltransferase family A protein [Leptolyngbyaceae cyanobacterium]
MTSKRLIFGIITLLNAKQFIQAAIESVFAQIYQQWELLLADDGSTLDADNVWLPKKFKQSVAIIEAQPETAMLYEYNMSYGWTGNSKESQRDRLLVGIELHTIFKPLILLIMLQRRATAPCTCSILVQHQA